MQQSETIYPNLGLVSSGTIHQNVSIPIPGTSNFFPQVIKWQLLVSPPFTLTSSKYMALYVRQHFDF